jgi:hypothetical protein
MNTTHDTRTHTDDTGRVWTLADTLAARATANAILIAHAVLVQDARGEWTPNAARDVTTWQAARDAHAHAARVARAITATPRGTYAPDERAIAAAQATQRIADARMAARATHARAQAAHAPACDAHAPTRTHTGARRTWAACGRTGADARGYVRQARWTVRAMLDTVARERVAAMRAAEMMRGDTGHTRTHAAWERAMMAGDVVGHVRVRDGRTWDEWSQREVVNARETRATERGRGTVKRGPSAARVTTRDVYAPATTLRHLATVGHGTYVGHTSYPWDIMAAILAHPTWATYTVTRGPVWPADGPTDATGYTPRTRPVGPHTRPVVLPVHAPEDDAAQDDAAQVARVVNPAHAQAERDHAAMAAMGTIHHDAA